MRYGVIICPHCKTGKIIELKHKSTTCIRCGKRLLIKKIKVLYQTDSLEGARQSLGQMNAKKWKT